MDTPYLELGCKGVCLFEHFHWDLCCLQHKIIALDQKSIQVIFFFFFYYYFSSKKYFRVLGTADEYLHLFWWMQNFSTSWLKKSTYDSYDR